jgi:hypothetical protein
MSDTTTDKPEVIDPKPPEERVGDKGGAPSGVDVKGGSGPGGSGGTPPPVEVTGGGAEKSPSIKPELEREEPEERPNFYRRFFSDEYRIKDIGSDKCEIPDESDIVEKFRHSHCLAIVSRHLHRCQQAAAKIALGLDYACYFSDAPELGYLEIPDLLEFARNRQSPTCVIRNYINNRQFARSITKVEMDVKDLFHSKAAIIFYLHPGTLEDIKGTWPLQMVLLKLPDSGITGGGGGTELAPAERIEQLFVPNKSSPAAVYAEQERLIIPRTLVRLGVLFSGLSPASFGRLLEAALGKKMIEISPATEKKEAERISAWEIWKAGPSAFEREAGISRTTAASLTSIGFVSDEMEAAAREWVWKYADDLLDVFSSISRLSILFGEDWTDEQKVLLRRYIQATAELAHRAPFLFDAQWLETIRDDYVAWACQQTPDADLAATNIFELLSKMAAGELRNRLFNRFSNRMALLIRELQAGGSERVVRQFFERLIQCNLQGLMLAIIHEMSDGITPDQCIDWIERSIKNSRQADRELAGRELATKLAWRPQDAPVFLDKLQGWMKPGPRGGISNLYDAAIVFPAHLFFMTEDMTFDPASASSPLLEILRCQSGGTTFLSYCESAMDHPEFAARIGEYLISDEVDERERPLMALAYSLYWCAVGLPNAERNTAFGLSRRALERLNISERSRVRSHWSSIAEERMAEIKKLPTKRTAVQDLRKKDQERRRLAARELMKN